MCLLGRGGRDHPGRALADLVDRLDGTWHTVLSAHFDDAHHPIRVGVIAKHPLTQLVDQAAFPTLLRRVQSAGVSWPYG